MYVSNQIKVRYFITLRYKVIESGAQMLLIE